MAPRSDDAGDLTVATFRRLLRTALSIKRVVRPLFAEAGLTGAQFHTLVRIPDQGIPLTKLAAKSWTDPGNASGVVDRLERDGLVERRSDSHDRRVVLVHTTTAGRDCVCRLWPAYVEAIHRIMASLSPAELAGLSELLERLTGEEDEHVDASTTTAATEG